jgi:hypothetical protein
MKIRTVIFLPLLIIATVLLFLAFPSCKKDESISSEIVLNNLVAVSPFKVEISGEFKKLSSDSHPESGVCYSTTNQTPGVGDEKRIFLSAVYERPIKDSAINLLHGKTYFMRLYVVDGNTVVYSNAKQIAMPSAAPIAKAASNITMTSATLNGTVNGYGKVANARFEFGTSTAYGQNIDISPVVITGTSNINVTANINNLSAGTTYHYRINITYIGIGNIPGNDITFMATPLPVPAATTLAVANLFYNKATLKGEVNANDFETSVSFEYGPTQAYGNVVNASPHMVTGANTTSVSANLNGLTPQSAYNYRVKAVNSGGTTYGSNISFTTPAIPAPTATTLTATPYSHSSIITGKINTHGIPGTVSFEYGATTAYSQSVVVASNIVTNSDSVITCQLTGLNPQSTYHFCIKVVDAGGTVLGSDKTFTTTPAIQIGDNYAGGIVFYLDASQEHGFVCAASDLSATALWGNYHGILGTGSDIGSGYNNTSLEEQTCGYTSAAHFCWYLSLNGYDDWFLPSRNELNLMYINLKVNLNNVAGFAPADYWSSSEDDVYYNGNNAWKQNFGNGTKTIDIRTAYLHVRAVRTF